LTPLNDGARKADRRRTPRYPFSANAEFTDTASGPRIEGRVSDIGMNGCFIETPNPPPEGAQIFVKIFKDPDFFGSAATVAYSQPNRGMGVQFRDVNPLFLPTLHKWLLEAMNVPPA
jgi:PilZ domain-containing protein